VIAHCFEWTLFQWTRQTVSVCPGESFFFRFVVTTTIPVFRQSSLVCHGEFIFRFVVTTTIPVFRHTVFRQKDFVCPGEFFFRFVVATSNPVQTKGFCLPRGNFFRFVVATSNPVQTKGFCLPRGNFFFVLSSPPQILSRQKDFVCPGEIFFCFVVTTSNHVRTKGLCVCQTEKSSFSSRQQRNVRSVKRSRVFAETIKKQSARNKFAVGWTLCLAWQGRELEQDFDSAMPI